MFETIAGVASILGLAVSVAAWWNAREAKHAARETREAMLLTNAAEELRTLSSKAIDLLGLVQAGHLEGACVRSCDLVQGVSIARSRWAKNLPTATKQNLDVATGQLAIISRYLARERQAASPVDPERLVRFCHQVVVALGVESGKILAVIERGKSRDER